jgi:hypothetical protein
MGDGKPWRDDRQDRRSFKPNDRPQQTYQLPPRAPEELLASRTLTLERKTIHVMVKKNSRGSFLRIVEESGNTRSSVIIPDSGIRDFIATVTEVTTRAGL